MTKLILCAVCKKETAHEVEEVRTPNQHDETVATCGCGHAIKWDGHGVDVNALAIEHAAANTLE